MIYVIGALKNKEIPKVAKSLREVGFEVYDEWWCPGEFADQNWQDYSKFNGLNYTEALDSWHARQVFEIDKGHLDRCSEAILVLPAGKSAHLELGYIVGTGKRGYILLDSEPDRYDLMYKFATLVTTDLEEIITHVKSTHEVGPSVLGASGFGGLLEQRPLNSDRCSHSLPKSQCAECWVQWLSIRNER